MQDKRKYQRLSHHIDLKYQVIYSLGFGSDIKDGVGKTHSVNLGEGGIEFSCQEAIPQGSLLEIELKLPGQDYPIYLKGEVAHIHESGKGYDVGIKFGYKLEKDSQVLQKYVLEHTLPISNN